MLESIEGKKGFPRYKPPFPAVKGLFGSPTIINNVETLASIPKIINNGPEWFSSLGTKDSPGFKCFSVSGHVNKPGNYEIPLGTPFKELLELAGGMKDEKKIKAVIPGGSSVPVVPGKVMMETNMDYESITKAGSMLGSGAVIVMDEDTNMVEVIHRIARFYYSESCGQCTPCREGTGWMYKIIDKILKGKGTLEDIKTLESIPGMIAGSTICALGDAAAMPVESFIRNYKNEFINYIKDEKDVVDNCDNNNKEFFDATKMKIKINNKECSFKQGETVIQVADRNGIHIPRFCYHDKLSIAANCRMCLVEQAGINKPQPACSTPAIENQEYFTKSK